jgi:hypothetical protein
MVVAAPIRHKQGLRILKPRNWTLISAGLPSVPSAPTVLRIQNREAPIQAPYSGVICWATLTKLLREGLS